MKRIYNRIIAEHFKENRQMAFLSGPRQVGKTTLSKAVSSDYLTWDNQKDRANILLGPNNIATQLDIDTLMKAHKIVTFDELHKYSKWKTFIKGFFDSYGDKLKCCVTGSARLNIFKKGGDSLMGRYFIYRMHPFSVSEILTDKIAENEIRKPQIIDNSSFEQLLTFGGFPEPLLKADKRFYNRWRRLRTEQFFHEDIRDLTNVQEIAQLEILAEILKNQTGQLANYSTLANAINVSVDTIRRWIQVLENLYFCFCIKPWSSNVKKSLLKQPKIYLWDWTLCGNIGARNENFIASHLLKAVHLWTDIGIGDYELFYIRDKIKREVDFLVTKNKIPWFLVEVKTSKDSLSPNLKFFQQQIKAEYAFQVTINMDYVDRDCFTESGPVIVPAKTFLSQLV
jgi:uncharacterized protein